MKQVQVGRFGLILAHNCSQGLWDASGMPPGPQGAPRGAQRAPGPWVGPPISPSRAALRGSPSGAAYAGLPASGVYAQASSAAVREEDTVKIMPVGDQSMIQ